MSGEELNGNHKKTSFILLLSFLFGTTISPALTQVACPSLTARVLPGATLQARPVSLASAHDVSPDFQSQDLPRALRRAGANEIAMLPSEQHVPDRLTDAMGGVILRKCEAARDRAACLLVQCLQHQV